MERIIGADTIEGKLLFQVKLKNHKIPLTIVPAEYANAKFPQHVIKFYEQRVRWDD